MRRPVILVIMDGWGVNPGREGNAVLSAETPVLDRLLAEYPSTELGASGSHVGLPEGQMGNSEVGHLNIGAGRIVYQDFTRISKSIESGEFNKNKAILDVMDGVSGSGNTLHFMGLLSDGGVHSHISQLFALLELAKKRGVENVAIHAFMDGRDTPPQSGISYIKSLEAHIEKTGVGAISTVMGRFYAMDRDNRWDRIEEAFRAMTSGGARRAPSALSAMEMAYSEGKSDEFVPPTVIDGGQGSPHYVRDDDSIIFFNFRSDRAREITRAFTEKTFNAISGLSRPCIKKFLCMTEYDQLFDLPLIFPPVSLNNLLGDIVSAEGMRQLRIAETEKYAHVTFFFNGGAEEPSKGEERLMVPSPKEVKTYDLKPEMSASKVTDEVIKKMDEGNIDLIVLNYANCDMVGHTGVMEAAVRAVEAVDASVGRILGAVQRNNYRLLITADHGNAEQMVDPDTGQPHTAHTTNPVCFILVDEEMKGRKLRKGILADISPTVLDLFDIKKPSEMDGTSLIEAA